MVVCVKCSVKGIKCEEVGDKSAEVGVKCAEVGVKCTVEGVKFSVVGVKRTVVLRKCMLVFVMCMIVGFKYTVHSVPYFRGFSPNKGLLGKMPPKFPLKIEREKKTYFSENKMIFRLKVNFLS